MKDFVEDIKAGFRDLPRFLPPVIILCWAAVVFGGGVNAALNILIVCLGVWAVIFIIFPSIILVLGFVGKIYSICQKKFDKWNKNTPEKDFEEI